jgi:hypothetical protein
MDIRVGRNTHGSIGIRMLRLGIRARNTRPYGWMDIRVGRNTYESIGIRVLRLGIRARNARPYGEWVRD